MRAHMLELGKTALTQKFKERLRIHEAKIWSSEKTENFTPSNHLFCIKSCQNQRQSYLLIVIEENVGYFGLCIVFNGGHGGGADTKRTVTSLPCTYGQIHVDWKFWNRKIGQNKSHTHARAPAYTRAYAHARTRTHTPHTHTHTHTHTRARAHTTHKVSPLISWMSCQSAQYPPHQPLCPKKSELTEEGICERNKQP